MHSTPLIMLPGYGDSGPTHWQTHWQEANPRITRFAPSSWTTPVLADWVTALERAVESAGAPPVLIAHSLSCLLVAHWAARGARRIAGAMLVAAPDPSLPQFPASISGFDELPAHTFAFPTLVVASSNDPYASAGFSRTMAKCWGARLVDIGPCGHINPAAGITDWPQGQALLAAFENGIRP